MVNILETYKEFLENQELAEGTQQIYMRYAGEIEKYSTGKPITKKTVVAYKQEKKQRGAAPATVNLAIIAINKYLRFVGNSGSTVRTEKIQKRCSLENVLEIEAYYRMLEAARDSGRKKETYGSAGIIRGVF